MILFFNKAVQPLWEGKVSIYYQDIDNAVQSIVSCKMFKDEIIEVLKYNYAHIHFVDKRNEFPYVCPLDLHCAYSTDQVLAAFVFCFLRGSRVCKARR